MKMPPTVIDNRYSRLLNNEENMQIFKLLGNRCQSISTTVAQLFCTEPPYHSQWLKKDTGVLCFVKDNSRKNYFFRMFCLRRNCMIWEHEMYRNMDYMESTVFLHIFEGEDVMIAFNFANSEEAKEFKMVVDDKILVRKKREEKRAKQHQRSPMTIQNNIINSHTLKEPHDYKKSQDPAAKSAKRRRNITKADIGVPLDFKHISHVGWNPDSGFDIDSQDEQLTCFFEKAGISEKQLQDPHTKEFIYDFINKHGGREAIEESTNLLSARRAPAVPPQSTAPPVPPVPPRGSTRSQHVRVAPPPPPVPSPNAFNSVENEKPIPPPPPPADFGWAPPPPPVPAFSDVPHGDAPIPPAPSMMGSALMESIKTGTTLKPVEDRKMPPSPVEDSRGLLLKEIREGTKLKPVCERDVKPVNNVVEPNGCDLAEALARALAERSKAIHSEDDDDEDDSNDDEWED